ncbi:MAG TPA: cysteine--tRNA ligase [Bacteroidales bacterium]|nr:cysteine--tRNA ligase [Bacteroidales bacterium]
MKELHIYNSLTRQKEKFTPLHKGFVGIYVCGPTVYGDAHLGHAKSYVSFDIVIRYFRYLGYRVRYVQNITDVGHLTDDADSGEDKLIKQARLERLEPMEIAEKYTYSYFRDMDKLGVHRPDISPRASGHIPEQIALIQKLIETGHAYESNGNVYFDVSSDPEYGKLSGRKREEAVSGTRVNTAGDKKNPEDFALWKKADPTHIMKWPSPWSEGYPGWHVECSAMSTKYLGETFDIHAGGIENQFPHHECEIAQSEGANKKTFARFWMHNNMVTLNGQKMGKSLGNAISLQQFYTGKHELLSRSWKPEVIRFFLLQSHYRSTTDFSEDALEAAETGLKKLHEIFRILENAVKGNTGPFDVQNLKEEVEEQLNDDFNSAKAIAVLFEKLRPLKNEIQKGNTPSNVEEVFDYVKQIADGVLGIWIKKSEQVQANKDLLDKIITLLIEMRQDARKNKHWQLADNIRDRLSTIGIILEDTPEGTNYKIES